MYPVLDITLVIPGQEFVINFIFIHLLSWT